MKNIIYSAAMFLAIVFMATQSHAQNDPDVYKTPDGHHNVAGVVTECVSGGIATPCSPTGGGSGGGGGSGSTAGGSGGAGGGCHAIVAQW